MRKPKRQSKRYEKYDDNGKNRRKNWRRRRRARIKDAKLAEDNLRHRYFSILMLLFAKRRKKHESLYEYRLRLLNLEVISCIIIVIVAIVIIISTSS